MPPPPFPFFYVYLQGKKDEVQYSVSVTGRKDHAKIILLRFESFCDVITGEIALFHQYSMLTPHKYYPEVAKTKVKVNETFRPYYHCIVQNILQ